MSEPTAETGDDASTENRSTIPLTTPIPNVGSFVELLHWIRRNRINQRYNAEQPPDHRELFARLEQLGFANAERRIVARHGFDPDVTKWEECCDEMLGPNESATLYADEICEEEMKRNGEFPESWIVVKPEDWPEVPIRNAAELAAHLREEAREFSKWSPLSPLWYELANALWQNATVAATSYGLSGATTEILPENLLGAVSKLIALADRLVPASSQQSRPRAPADWREVFKANGLPDGETWWLNFCKEHNAVKIPRRRLWTFPLEELKRAGVHVPEMD